MGKGYLVVVKNKGKWSDVRYKKTSRWHYRGEYLLFKSYGRAEEFAEKHIENRPISKWMK